MNTKQSIKPVVHYTPTAYDKIIKGQSAVIMPKDHPSPLVSNKNFVKTSEVLKKTADGFETRNTIYKEINHEIHTQV